jgi:hypothetical protein
MVWRIHFTPDDLERVQVSPTLGPLAETVMAVMLLRCPEQPRGLFSEWRGQVQGKLTPRMKPLTALIPPGTRGVDLCTLTGEATMIQQGVQALLDVPREHLLVEMEYTDRRSRLSAAAWALAETDGRQDLAEATQAAYLALVEPYWTRIRALLHAEQAARRRTLAREGAGRLLASLQGQRIRWRPPVLEILMPSDLDMHLDGKGIALVPSLFVGKDPGLHENPNDDTDVPRLVLPAAGLARRRFGASGRRRSISSRGPVPGSEWTTGCGFHPQDHRRQAPRQSLSAVAGTRLLTGHTKSHQDR